MVSDDFKGSRYQNRTKKGKQNRSKRGYQLISDYLENPMRIITCSRHGSVYSTIAQHSAGKIDFAGVVYATFTWNWAEHNVANINFQLFYVLSNYFPPYRANFLQSRIPRHPAVKSIIFTLMRNSETSVGRWKILRSCLFLASGNEIMRPSSFSIDIGEKQENCSISLSESEPRIIDKFVT